MLDEFPSIFQDYVSLNRYRLKIIRQKNSLVLQIKFTNVKWRRRNLKQYKTYKVLKYSKDTNNCRK